MVDRGERRFRLDQDPPEHAVGDVGGDVPVSAVIHEEARIEEPGLDGGGLPGGDDGRLRPAPLTGD